MYLKCVMPKTLLICEDKKFLCKGPDIKNEPYFTLAVTRMRTFWLLTGLMESRAREREGHEQSGINE